MQKYKVLKPYSGCPLGAKEVKLHPANAQHLIAGGYIAEIVAKRKTSKEIRHER